MKYVFLIISLLVLAFYVEKIISLQISDIGLLSFSLVNYALYRIESLDNSK
jgi:hypothetical protein